MTDKESRLREGAYRERKFLVDMLNEESIRLKDRIEVLEKVLMSIIDIVFSCESSNEIKLKILSLAKKALEEQVESV